MDVLNVDFSFHMKNCYVAMAISVGLIIYGSTVVIAWVGNEDKLPYIEQVKNPRL